LGPVLPDGQMDFILDDGMGLSGICADDQDAIRLTDFFN
jgi:hypothetical protein